MVEIQNRINELNKLREESIDKIEILQKTIIRKKIRPDVEIETDLPSIVRELREENQKLLEKCKVGVSILESRIADYDKEIEECRNILGEAKQKFPLHKESTEKWIKSYEELYEELYKLVVKKIKREQAECLENKNEMLSQEDIDALLSGGTITLNSKINF